MNSMKAAMKKAKLIDAAFEKKSNEHDDFLKKKLAENKLKEISVSLKEPAPCRTL